MIKKYSYRVFGISFHDVQLFSAVLFFLLIPLKNTGIVHYVIWLGVIATTGNIVLTAYNNGVKKKDVGLFLVLLVNIVVNLIATRDQLAGNLLYAIVCYFSLYWVIALNDTFSQSLKKLSRFINLLYLAVCYFPFIHSCRLLIIEMTIRFRQHLLYTLEIAMLQGFIFFPHYVLS